MNDNGKEFVLDIMFLTKTVLQRVATLRNYDGVKWNDVHLMELQLIDIIKRLSEIRRS